MRAVGLQSVLPCAAGADQRARLRLRRCAACPAKRTTSGAIAGQAPIVQAGGTPDPARFADPLPQALVLTAIVIGFAMTALFLVVLLASRGFTDTDHVDGDGGHG